MVLPLSFGEGLGVRRKGLFCICKDKEEIKKSGETIAKKNHLATLTSTFFFVSTLTSFFFILPANHS